MPTTEQLRGRLIDKLKELFQLDQPDLDFGFYRIMHARAEQITDFFTTDLLKIVENAFGQVDDVTKKKLKAKYDQELQNAKDYGAPEPEDVLKVKEAKAKYEAASHTESTEGEIYDHLYRFFERYYDNGDFLSLRYYTRETSDKAAPYAIPYNGEEVKLYWANADQYYIKTAEYFTNFTFDLNLAVKKQQELNDRNKKGHKQIDLLTFTKATTSPLKVNFRIIEAAEGEHGNIKAGNATKRFFIIHKNNPVGFNKDGELIVHFEYRPDPKKTGQEKTWQDKRNDEAVETIFKELETTKDTKSAKEYLRLLEFPAPTEKNKKRSLLAKYVNQYTARNTCDYFIHKDLGRFLRRELDFYIKNEVMRLDDIENADVPAVESYLTKIKILRKISHKIIDFLAQLEDFQKKLWLKKKFVVETNYCITLDRVPEALYPEIADNEAQRKEWVKLFAIDEIKGDLHSRKYSKPLTMKFLKENPFLVVDTGFFDEEFKKRLIASIDGFDEQCDGLLIHSENFQALNLLQERYREQVKCVYIDPPYNAKSSEIIYKNTYKHSSFLSLLHNRFSCSMALLDKCALFNVAIDDYEHRGTLMVLDNVFSPENFVANVVVQHNPRGRNDDKFYGTSHEYMIVYAVNKSIATLGLFHLNDEDRSIYKANDEVSAYHEVSFMRTGNNSDRNTRPNLFYPIYVNVETLELSLEQKHDFVQVLPINSNGEEKTWRWEKQTFLKKCSTEISVKIKNGVIRLYKKRRLEGAGKKPKTIWYESKYDASSNGIMFLRNFLGKDNEFSYPKSIHTVQDALFISTKEDDLILDYFAGSGTTAHAVININREDNGHRKYILVEMGDYFDTVLKPRIQKVIYSESWKNGKPTARHTGVSHCFKYLRLESYEDTLNNLSFNNNSKAYQSNPDLYEEYMLRYLLDVETRGSQSLLNIDAFADPCAYKLKVKQPGSDEYVVKNVDLLETFNYLIGLSVVHIAAPLAFTAKFKREPDPELPENQQTRLIVDGRIKQDKNGPWWFRKVEGWIPSDPSNPNNGQKENVLIVWRKLTGNLEQDNLMLDEWFQKNRISTRDFEFDTIYVNGSNNLQNLKLKNENWKVRLIEEEFSTRMWDMEEV